MNPIGLIFVAGGAFSILGAICNWEWFMNARKAKFIVKVFTRNGARIFYGLLGLALVILGVLGAIGAIDISQR